MVLYSPSGPDWPDWQEYKWSHFSKRTKTQSKQWLTCWLYSPKSLWQSDYNMLMKYAMKHIVLSPPVSFLHCFSFFPPILWKHCHWRGRKSIGVLFRSHHDYLHIGEIMFTNLDSMKSSPLCPGIFVWQAPQRNIQRGQVERIEKALCSSKVTPLSKLANLKYNNIDLHCFVGRQFLLQIYMFFSVTRRSRSDESHWVTKR